MRAVTSSEERAYSQAMRGLESFCDAALETGLDECGVITLLLSRAAALATSAGVDRVVVAEACLLAFDAVQPEREDPQ